MNSRGYNMGITTTLKAYVAKILNSRRNIVAELEYTIDSKKSDSLKYKNNLVDLDTQVIEVRKSIVDLMLEKDAIVVRLDEAIAHELLYPIEEGIIAQSQILMQAVMESENDILEMQSVRDELLATRESLKTAITDMVMYINKMSSKVKIIKVRLQAAKSQNDVIESVSGIGSSVNTGALVEEINTLINNYENRTTAIINLTNEGVLGTPTVDNISAESVQSRLATYRVNKV